jgi:hypothetical protein
MFFASLYRRCYGQADATPLRAEREQVVLLRLSERLSRRARLPVTYCSDKHTVFRINRDAKSGLGMTQYGRALAELNTDAICVPCSQVKELQSDDVCDMQAGNAFLPKFIKRFNKKFSVAALKPKDLHRSISLSRDRLSHIFVRS